MSLWKKTMDYLGLGPDDAYDDYDDELRAGTPLPGSSVRLVSPSPNRDGMVVEAGNPRPEPTVRTVAARA